jgi:hypothetical protein
LFFIYLGISCWLITKIKFITNTKLGHRTIIILFLLRLIVGLINGYISLYYYPRSDTYTFQLHGLEEYDLLLNAPRQYFTNWFTYDYHNSNVLWNNLSKMLMIKMMSVFDIFSRGNFFINIIFYNFLAFFGPVAFYRIFINLFPGQKKMLLIGLFFLPSLLYFSTAIHKDGLIFLGLGICCYHLFYMMREGASIKRILCLFIGFSILLLLRNFVLITLIPAMTAWLIAEKNRKFAFPVFTIVYLFFIILFFNARRLHPALDLPKYVSTRQIAFVEIANKSQSAVNVNSLYPTFSSFLTSFPQALNHSLIRPYITETTTLLYIPAAIEIIIYEILLLIFLLFRRDQKPDPFISFGIFFSLSMFLMIGYTIPILGAIVRYRSIYFPFLVIPVLCYIDWNKVKAAIHLKK